MTDTEQLDRGTIESPQKNTTPASVRFIIVISSLALAGFMIYFGLKSAGVFSAASDIGAKAKQQQATPTGSGPPAPVHIKVPLDLPAPAPVQTATVCANGAKLPPGMKCPDLKPVPAATDSVAGTDTTGPSSGANNSPGAASTPIAKDPIRERRFAGSVDVATPGTVTNPPPIGAVTTTTPIGEGTAIARPIQTPSVLEAQLSPITTPGASATLASNPSLTLARGTMPDCTLNNAIRTGQAGFLKCTIARPVYSMNGRVVLMEAGTVVEGEYTTGVTQGQQAIFALWTRARTPHDVFIQLNSSSTDGLGRAGIPGYVDNKFFDRFAGAIFFSLFDDATTAASKNNSGSSGSAGGGSVSVYNNTSTTTKALVEEMLTQGRAIKPELFKNQGEAIRIYISRDVDFSTVYALDYKGTPNQKTSNGR